MTLKHILFASLIATTAVFASTSANAQKQTAIRVDAQYKAPYTGAELAKLTDHPERIVTIKTKQGDIKMQLFEKLAPKHVANMLKLIGQKFYDGTYFHRCIEGFMIQGGDNLTKDNDYSNDGTGGSSDRVPAEFSKVHHSRGVLSAARTSDPNSATSQFFLCQGDAGMLDGQYTVYGQIVSGMDIVDKIVHLPDVTTRSKAQIQQQGPNPGRAATIVSMTVANGKGVKAGQSDDKTTAKAEKKAAKKADKK